MLFVLAFVAILFVAVLFTLREFLVPQPGLVLSATVYSDQVVQAVAPQGNAA